MWRTKDRIVSSESKSPAVILRENGRIRNEDRRRFTVSLGMRIIYTRVCCGCGPGWFTFLLWRISEGFLRLVRRCKLAGTSFDKRSRLNASARIIAYNGVLFLVKYATFFDQLPFPPLHFLRDIAPYEMYVIHYNIEDYACPASLLLDDPLNALTH